MNSSSSHISDEQKLKNNLQDGNRRCDCDKEVLIIFMQVQSSGNDAEHRVEEKSESWHAKQDVVQVALLFDAELQALNSTKKMKV